MQQATQTSVQVVRVPPKQNETVTEASLQRRTGAQAGGDGEEIRRAVQGCLRCHPAVNVTAGEAEAGNRFACET